ncbi:zinc finger protein 385B [Anarhichas minor]|uniref:zinc finger protein 385B n=1 Tax=Anarhichas minor TaxID=65739 RepID=UPI003F732210
MKTPLSPSQLLERGQIFAFGGMCQELMDPPTPTTISLSVQQNPSPAYSLCEVCNLQLTSSAQVQLHYNGRSHLRRVRQLQARETGQQAAGTLQPLLSSISSSRSIGSSSYSSTVPGLIGATGPSVMMKPFLTFPVETTPPVGLFPNFNTMDPVQKAVINHTFGVSLVPKRKQVISCNVCQLRFNSDSQAEAHYRGSRHVKKIKSQENKTKAKQTITGETNGSIPSPVCPAPPVSANCSTNQHTPGFFSTSSSSPPSSKASQLPAPPAPVTSSSSAPPSQASSQDAPLSVESEEEKAKKLLYCSLCKVAVNSLSQLEAHNAGSKHKTMLEARSGAGPIKAYPRTGAKLKSVSGSVLKGSGLQNKTFHCQICDVHVNSEIQLKQHISSRRHKDRVAGKPSKPKYSPYNKQQHSSLTVSVSLCLQKELVKPSLSPPFLSNPFAPPPCSLTSTISLPPAPLSSSLLTPISSRLTPTISLCPRPPTSSSLFTTSFLRPAPGPMRASQGSILFTPY